MDQNARQQIIDRLKEANNVLITVSANPSVDQLAACIGITLVLNHLGKHATAVFSGDVPSTIEFLKPEATLEKNTDSLRDFIIALDKSKADKLRYKVEDKVVKIFITPYRTSLSERDLEFSQGDFNVDAVLAIGVHERTDLDKAIVAHGRILHDATVISINNKDQGNLGAINWVDLNASSLAEMMAELTKGIATEAIDGQMATAFMTGIVAETDRFSNTKTSPQTMSLAAELMAAGANQQLIASKLENSKPIPKLAGKEAAAETSEDDGTGLLEISHPEEAAEEPKVTEEPQLTAKPEPVTEPSVPEPQIKRDLLGPSPRDSVGPTIRTNRPPLGPEPSAPATEPSRASGRNMAWEPPSLGGQLTANSQPEHMQVEPSTDPLSLPAVDSQPTQPPLLNRNANLNASAAPAPLGAPESDQTLSGIEEAVASPHVAAAAEEIKTENVEEAREAVDDAIAAQPPIQPLTPLQGLGAQPVDLNPATTPVANEPAPIAAPSAPAQPDPFQPTPAISPATDQSAASPANPMGPPPDMNGVNPNVPPSLLPPSQPVDNTAASGSPTAPPPVPPPFNPAP